MAIKVFGRWLLDLAAGIYVLSILGVHWVRKSFFGILVSVCAIIVALAAAHGIYHESYGEISHQEYTLVQEYANRVPSLRPMIKESLTDDDIIDQTEFDDIVYHYKSVVKQNIMEYSND